MRLLDRYIFIQLFTATIVICLGFLSAAIITRSLRYIDWIVNKGLAIKDFFQLLLYLIPSMLQVVLPVSLFIACIFVYNKMSSDSEMVVQTSSGISPGRLRRPVYILGVLVGIFLFYNGAYLQPKTFRDFRTITSDVGVSFVLAMVSEGQFIDVGRGFTVYIEDITPEGTMKGLMIRDERSERAHSTIFAKEGVVGIVDDVPHLVLKDGVQRGIDRKTLNPIKSNFDSYVVPIEPPEQPDKIYWRKAQEEYLWDIHKVMKGARNEKHRRKLLTSFHERILTPFLTLAFALIAVNMILAADHSRRGLRKYIMLAIFWTVTFQVLAVVVRDTAVRNEGLVFLMYLNTALAFLLAIFARPILQFLTRPSQRTFRRYERKMARAQKKQRKQRERARLKQAYS